MRPGQHNNNNKRGRNRNRGRHSGGGGGGSSGGNYNGNPANRVYDSNGPDVKLRGTAQTVAEKYMQLGRDAQASGDTVASESYFQHSEHYYRLWLANQPAGQPIQFARRNDEEFDEEETEGGEDEGEAQRDDAAEGSEPGIAAEGEQPAPGDTSQQTHRPRDRDDRGGEQGQKRDRFRRWPPRSGGRPERNGRPEQSAGGQGDAEQDTGPAQEAREENWEAPSFLTRPVPSVPAVESPETGDEAQETRRPRREFRPRRPRNQDEPTGDTPATTPETGDV